MTRRLYGIALSVLLSSANAYADSTSTIQQINSNADLIAAQAQANIKQQQEILAQRLQALSTAMQAQIPNISVQQPFVAPAPTPVQAVAAIPAQPVATSAAASPQATKTQPAMTQQPNITGLTPSPQNNDPNNRNQWNYGF